MSDLFERANNGDLEAQFALGLLYELGLDRPADFRQAFFWWKKAADAGDTRSMAKVAESYALGRGVDRNDELAAQWSEKAQVKGFEGGEQFARKRRAQRLSNKAKAALVISAEGLVFGFLLRHLEAAGMHVHHSSTPNDAMKYFDERPNVNFVFSDLNMSGMNAFNIITTLKQKSKSKPTFIVVADKVTKEDITSGKQVGVDAWLVKPLTKFAVNKIIAKS